MKIYFKPMVFKYVDYFRFSLTPAIQFERDNGKLYFSISWLIWIFCIETSGSEITVKVEGE